MANIKIKAAVNRISDDLNATVKHAVQYSGVGEDEAAEIERVCEVICEQAARLVGMARVAGNKKSIIKYKPDEDLRLVKKVRKAFGYNG